MSGFLKKLFAGKNKDSGKKPKTGGKAEEEAVDELKQRYCEQPANKSFNPAPKYNNLR